MRVLASNYLHQMNRGGFFVTVALRVPSVSPENLLSHHPMEGIQIQKQSTRSAGPFAYPPE